MVLTTSVGVIPLFSYQNSVGFFKNSILFLSFSKWLLLKGNLKLHGISPHGGLRPA